MIFSRGVTFSPLNSIAGIDEAGRGPLIGPLVICLASTNNSNKLIEIGVKDSKKISAKKRMYLYNQLLEFCSFYFIKIDAIDLDKEMEKMSLNEIEARAMAELMSVVKIKTIIDLPDRYPKTFSERMKKYPDLEYLAEHKADDKYPIVSAASIAAKVNRDNFIEEIKNECKIDFGSGYPSDPKTKKAFLENHKSIEPFIRKKWKIKIRKQF